MRSRALADGAHRWPRWPRQGCKFVKTHNYGIKSAQQTRTGMSCLQGCPRRGQGSVTKRSEVRASAGTPLHAPHIGAIMRQRITLHLDCQMYLHPPLKKMPEWGDIV